MSHLQTRLQRAADEAAGQGRIPGPEAVIRRGRQRRRRLIGGTASLVILVLLAGALGTDRLASRPTPLPPVPITSPTIPTPTTTSPTTTSGTPIPAAVKKVVKLDIPVHLGPAGFPDRFGMASDLATVMEACEGGTAQVRMWAQVLGETWVLAAKEPLPGKNWICWSDGLWDKGGGTLFGGHGGSRNRLKLLQASQLSETIRGRGELAVVGGPVTRQAVRLRILFRSGRPIDLVPLDAGPQFPVKFYAVFYLQPAKTAWMPERVVAYDKAGRKIAECWTTTGQGNVCDRPQGAPQPP
jgi:hypothetical protein